MKKYALFLFVFAFILLNFNVNSISALVFQGGSSSGYGGGSSYGGGGGSSSGGSSYGGGIPGCTATSAYSTTTGQSCGTTSSTGCASGNLFSSITGQPCSNVQPAVTLTIGSTGADVRAIQQILKNLGYYSYRVDGSYGRRTARAVEDFQEDNNLPVTGIVDVATRAVLNNIGGIVSPTPTPTQTSDPTYTFSPNGGTLVAGRDAWIFTLSNGKSGDVLAVDAFNGPSGTNYFNHLIICTVPTGSSSCSVSAIPSANPAAGDIGVWKETVFINGAQKGTIEFTVIAPPSSTAGAVSISLDSSTPAAHSVAPGSANIEMARIKISAGANEDMRLDTLAIGAVGLASDISIVYVYVDSTYLGALVLPPITGGSATFSFAASNVTIAKNTSKILSLRANISSSAQSGRTIALGVQGGTARGALSGVTTLVTGGTANGNPMIITSAPVASTPTFTFSPNGGTLVAGRDAWIFTLSNGKSGDVLAVDAFNGPSGTNYFNHLIICTVPTGSSSCSVSAIPSANPAAGDIGVWKETVFINGVVKGNISFTVSS